VIREALRSNVDSLHILSGAGRPPNVPLASQALERVRILPHATRRAAAAGGTPGRATPPARASLLMTVSRSPHLAHLIRFGLTAIIAPFWTVTQVFYNTCVTTVKHPFLPPWRACVTTVEGAEQGVF